MLFDTISPSFDNLYKSKLVLAKINFYILKKKENKQ